VWSEDAEAAVLGAMLVSPTAIGAVRRAGLEATDFYLERHRVLFDAMCAMDDAGTPVDSITVSRELRRTGRLEAAGGDTTVHALAATVPSTTNAHHHAQTVRDLAHQQRVASAAAEVAAAASNGGVTADTEARLLDVLQHDHQHEQDAMAQPWSAFRDSTSADVPYLVDDLWQEGAVTFIAGEPKGGKTWLALGLAIAQVTGLAFLAYTVPEPVPVTYVALEGHRAAVRARIGCLARGFGVDPDGTDLDRLHVIYKPRGFTLADAGWARRLCREVADNGSRVVYLDTLRSGASIRESAEGARDMAELLQRLNPLIADHVSACFLHHYTKLNETRQQRAAADRMSGSGALRGHMDFGLFITRADFTERRMRVELELRDGVAPGPLGVRLDGTGTGGLGRFTYRDTARLVLEEDALGEAQVKAPSGEIAAWIKEQPHGRATPKEIRDHFDITDKTLRSRRQAICSWGIEYVEAGRFTQYRVTEGAGAL
jgi:RecA-family ATPase